MRSREQARKEFETYLQAIQRELQAAPAWKQGTRWYTDRLREVEATQRRLELLEQVQ